MPTASYHRAHTFSVLTVALLCAGVALPVMAADTLPALRQQSGAYTFAITQQPLVAALNRFSQVTGWQVGLASELARDVSSPGAMGAFTPEKALDRLLSGTGLGYRKLGDNTVVLERSGGSAVALQQITVSATRQAQDVASVPSTVSVQAREEMDRRNVNTIRDIVRDEPGLSVGGAGQRAGTTGYNIRGIDGNRVLTQVDGVEIPDSFFYGPYAQTQRNYVDPEIVKRVEILRGPASVLYGSNAIGGAVSYYTLDAEDIIKPGEQAGARLKSGYSSADRSWLSSGTVAGRLGDFDSLLHLSQRNGHETQSYGTTGGTGLGRSAANPEDARTTNVLAKLGWDYADDARLALTYEHYKGERETAQKSSVGGPFLPGLGPVGYYRSRATDDTVTRERFGLEHSVALDTLLADHLKWSLNYQVAKTDENTRELYAPPGRVVERNRVTHYRDKQWLFDAQLVKNFAIADSDHQLTYGATFKRNEVTNLRTGNGICLAVSTRCPVIGQPSTTDALAPASDFPDPTVNTYSLFAQDQIRWHDWTFLPGARYDYTEIKPHITDAFIRGTEASPGEGVNNPGTRHWHKISPKLGVTYTFNDHFTWYGQYAEGFRTPTAKMLFGRFSNPATGYNVEPNPGLGPEKSKSYETGLRGHFDGGRFDITTFYNTYRDLIDENAVKTGFDERTFSAANIARATIKGVEAKGRLELEPFGAPQGLFTQGSIAYARGENQDTHQPLNSVNPLKAVLGLGYDSNTYGGLLNWTLVKSKDRVDSSTFKTPDGTSAQFKTPGFGVLDLTGYYRVTGDLTLNAGLYNLTDQKYWLWDDVRGYDGVGEAAQTQPANLDRLTQPGRNFAVNAVWEF